MRHAGNIDRKEHAERFVDYLLTKGVQTRVDEEAGGWAVWVYDEDQLQTVKDDLEWFVENPDDPVYDQQIKANAIRREQAKQDEKARRQIIRVRDHWTKPQRGPLTTVLVVACVAVGIVTMFGKRLDPVGVALSINRYVPNDDGGGSYNRNAHFADVKNGEVWRLITPMLLHFGLPHLVFNMLGLYYFGNFIEARRGSIVLFVLVLLLAIFSHAAEYQFSPGQSPMFGGMSGVLYGLFGYLWVKSLLDPTAGMNLQPSTIFIMMFWFILCWSGAVGPIANIAHTAGLCGGAVLGIVSTLSKNAPRG